MMMELKEMCPSCKTKIWAIINPENIQGDTVNICSVCKTLVVVENYVIRKMTFKEVLVKYKYIQTLCRKEASEILIIKLAWLKYALIKMRAHIASLN